MILKEIDELKLNLQDSNYGLPKDSLIKLSTYDTKWLENKIDPLSKIVAKGITAEEKEILEKSELIPFQSEEFSKIEARILTEFSEARWIKEYIEERSKILKESKLPRRQI